MNHPSYNFFLLIVLLLVLALLLLGLLIAFVRWLLGISRLERRVVALERELEALRNPAPAQTLSPREMTVVGGAPPSILGDIPRELGLLTLANGRPGLARLLIDVNGVRVEISDLADGEEKSLDLSDSMQPNDRNVVTLQGEGAGTASAQVTLSTF
jgi:hypothetical protein